VSLGRTKLNSLTILLQCTRFLATADAVRPVPGAAKEDTQGEISQGELRERKEKAQVRQAAQEPGAELSTGVDEVRSAAGREEVLGTNSFRETRAGGRGATTSRLRRGLRMRNGQCAYRHDQASLHAVNE